jgi:hypothetical protein
VVCGSKLSTITTCKTFARQLKRFIVILFRKAWIIAKINHLQKQSKLMKLLDMTSRFFVSCVSFDGVRCPRSLVDGLGEIDERNPKPG